jgi:hypothetical protein
MVNALSKVARKLLRDHIFSTTLTYCHSAIVCAGSSWLFMKLAEKRRADERTRTAYPCSLRVIHHALQGVAQPCETRIFRALSLPCLAQRCTVLRSRWYQSGVNVTSVSPPSCLIRSVSPSSFKLLRLRRSTDAMSALLSLRTCNAREVDRGGSRCAQYRRASGIDRLMGTPSPSLEHSKC